MTHLAIAYPVSSSDIEAAVDELDAHGSTELTTTLPVSADDAYELFCDIERIPHWLSIVHSVRVVGINAHGRAERASFLAHLDRGLVGYSLQYTYDGPARRVKWTTRNGAGVRVDGAARFTALGDKASLMHYELGLEVPVVGKRRWLDPFFDGHAASAVMHAFRDWVKGLHH